MGIVEISRSSVRSQVTWRVALVLMLLAALWIRWPVPSMAWTHIDEKALVNHPLGFFSGDLNPHFFNYPTLSTLHSGGRLSRLLVVDGRGIARLRRVAHFRR